MTDWPTPPFAVRNRTTGNISWGFGPPDAENDLYTIARRHSDGRSCEGWVNASELDLYTPQPGDWIPHWPSVWLLRGRPELQGVPVVSNIVYALLEPGMEKTGHRLALELPPVWIRKEQDP